MATIMDVAKKAGVSKTTVSKVLNDQYGVNADTRQRVLEAAKELDYIPNTAARCLAKSKSGVIGVLYDTLSPSVYLELAKYLEIYASKHGYNIVFSNCNGDIRVKEKYADYFAGGAADGIILFGSDTNDEGIASRMLEKQYPFVVIENHYDNIKMNNMLIDNVEGAKKAVNYLIGLGHKHIGHISGNISHRVASDRLNGFIKALQENNLTVNPEHIFYTNGSTVGSTEAIQKLIDMKDKPTALLAFNDNIAYKTILELSNAGFRVPEDFSIVGFDNIIEVVEFLPITVRLTSMAQPMKDVAMNTIEIIISNVEKKAAEVVEMNFNMWLVESKSCRRI